MRLTVILTSTLVHAPSCYNVIKENMTTMRLTVKVPNWRVPNLHVPKDHPTDSPNDGYCSPSRSMLSCLWLHIFPVIIWFTLLLNKKGCYTKIKHYILIPGATTLSIMVQNCPVCCNHVVWSNVVTPTLACTF